MASNISIIRESRVQAIWKTYRAFFSLLQKQLVFATVPAAGNMPDENRRGIKSAYVLPPDVGVASVDYCPGCFMKLCISVDPISKSFTYTISGLSHKLKVDLFVRWRFLRWGGKLWIESFIQDKRSKMKVIFILVCGNVTGNLSFAFECTKNGEFTAQPTNLLWLNSPVLFFRLLCKKIKLSQVVLEVVK